LIGTRDRDQAELVLVAYGAAVVTALLCLAAAGSAFAGPVGVWLSDGVACCVAILGYSAARAWIRHR
jgi:hypothetical protein